MIIINIVSIITVALLLRFKDRKETHHFRHITTRDRCASVSRRSAALSGTSGKFSFPADLATRLLEALSRPGDRVNERSYNHKQAVGKKKNNFFSRLGPGQGRFLRRVHDRHHFAVLCCHLPDHSPCSSALSASRLDFAFAGRRQAARSPTSRERDGEEWGSIHTYPNFMRAMLVGPDSPLFSIVSGNKADRNATSTRTHPHTPTIAGVRFVPAAASFVGLVPLVRDHLSAGDVPGDGVDVVVPSPTPYPDRSGVPRETPRSGPKRC